MFSVLIFEDKSGVVPAQLVLKYIFFLSLPVISLPCRLSVISHVAGPALLSDPCRAVSTEPASSWFCMEKEVILVACQAFLCLRVPLLPFCSSRALESRDGVCSLACRASGRMHELVLVINARHVRQLPGARLHAVGAGWHILPKKMDDRVKVHIEK